MKTKKGGVRPFDEMAYVNGQTTEHVAAEEEVAEEIAEDLPYTSFSLSVLPETTITQPYQIELPKGSNPMFFPVNAPLVGLAQDPDPVTRPLRNALWIARAWNYPLVLITGNIMHVDVTRAGKQQGFRAFATDARESDVLFENFETRLTHRLQSLRENFVDNDGNPIFQGPILGTFGRAEDEIINYYVNQKVRETVAAAQQQIDDQVKDMREQKGELGRRCKATQKLLEKQNRGQKLRDDEEERLAEDLESELERDLAEIIRLKAEMSRLQQARKLISQSDVSEAKKRQWFLDAQKRLIDLFEEHIPWLKIIATRNCFLQIGSFIVRVIQNPKETTADTYAGQVQNDLRLDQKNGKRLPDAVLIAGSNVTGAYFRVNYPKSEADPKETAETHIVELPMCINASFLQRLADLSVRVGPFLTRLVSTKFFTGGVAPCGWVSNIFTSHIWWDKDIAPQSPDSTGMSTRAYRMFANPKALEGYAQHDFMFYGEFEGDMQEGGKQQAYYNVPYPPFRLAPYEFHHRFFLEHNFPIHFYANLGDVVQGENHPYHREVAADYLNPHQAKALVSEVLASDMYLEEKVRLLARELVLNSWRNGVQRVDDQLQQYIEQAYGTTAWGSAYFAKVLRNAERIGLTFAEKAGIITVIGGNHIGNTDMVGEHFNEATICVERLRDILCTRHRFSHERVATAIQAPLGSAKTVTRALGAFGVLLDEDIGKDSSKLPRKKLPYCLSAKHKPTQGGARYSIAVKQMRGARMRIGTTVGTFADRFVLEVAGHIDRDQWCMIPNGLISISPGQEFQGPFAEEQDFALADMGTKIIGFPHDGAEPFGPVVHISVTYEALYQYIKNPWPIDVDALFPNAL